MTGTLVKKLQVKLKELGFDPGPKDGKFGAMTEAAVIAFQLSKSLVVDGEVGPETTRALEIEL
jgi:peptidoglycan hydrolase-like protein with peptidoglycan-binding domain